MASSAVHVASSGSKDRRRAVESRLAQLGPPPKVHRAPPPEGRLGPDEYPVTRIRAALADLGPVFAGFGRYLSSRVDLLPRRDALELTSIPDHSGAMTAAEVGACVARELGAPLESHFFEFDRAACDVTLWTERHRAWLAPGVPVLVTLVRPDAAAWLGTDLDLLPLLNPWFDVAPAAMRAAVEDFGLTLRRRLDQTNHVRAIAMLAADASTHGGFSAPVCYRDHCAPGILTLERPSGTPLADLMAEAAGAFPLGGREQLSRRLVSAWLRQAFLGRVVPFDFGPRDIVVDGERLVLVGGVFEAHSSGDRTRFLTYVNAVAADDPDAASAWILGAAAPDGPDRREDELRRRLRQAVPFRDGEWSGDDRLAEHVLVQWRMARQAGWPLTPHQTHLYRGLIAATGLAARLAPDEDALLVALQAERLQMGLTEAKRLLDPRVVAATLDRLLQAMVQLPQALDNILLLASEGRLRVKLNVPDGDDASQRRNRTVLLVAVLVALTGLASVARHFAPAFGPGVEQLAAVSLLVLGGWLLVVAARM